MKKNSKLVEDTSINQNDQVQDELLAEKEHHERKNHFEKSKFSFKQVFNSSKNKEDDEKNEHLETNINEIDAEKLESINASLESIKSKCKFKNEYEKNDVILSVNHLKQYFFFGKGAARQKLKAVHDVSFQVHEKEVFGIVGESGCGKTTTGKSIIRLYNITSGSIYYKGYRIGAGSRWNEKEIKFTNIRFNNKVKELKQKLKDGEITLDAYNEEYNKAKSFRDDVIRVQKAKIKQIKYDNKHADTLTVNEAKIEALERALKEEKKKKSSELNEANKINDESQKSAEIEKISAKYDENINLLNFKIKELKKNDHKLMREIQMIFQDPIDSLDPRMTVEQIISEGLQIQGYHNKAENHRKVVEALEKVGLIADYTDRYPHEFSGGQRQRIGIARALIMNPKLLICDEPISALDVSIRAQIINLLNELKEEMGLTIIFIAHDLSVVKYFCDRIAVMYFGEIVELATSDELFKHPLHPYTKSLLSAIPKPNPITERTRKRIVYNPQNEHDYSKEKPKLVEILPGHFILANSVEVTKYKEEIKKLDKKVK